MKHENITDALTKAGAAQGELTRVVQDELAAAELAEELGFNRDALGVMLATEDGFIMEFDVASIKRLWSLALRQRVELKKI